MHTLSPDVQSRDDSGTDDPDDLTTHDLGGVCVGGSYLFLEPLSGGATGTVWRALDRQSGTEVAVKLLREDLMRQPKAVTRFVQEHAILLMLRHPNIVRVHDLLTVGHSLGLVMDLVQGGSLRAYLDEHGPIPPAPAAELLAGVAAALAEAHRAGVVHRDLKPDNVLIDQTADGLHARLTDFGIARALDAPRLTTPEALVGTPNYMAPEVVAGARATPAVDVYALGVLLYELVVGRQPYAGGSALAVLRRQVDSAPQRVAGMPEGVWRVVQACMDKRPKRRPAARELVTTMRSLARLTAGVPALQPPDSEPTTITLRPADAAEAADAGEPKRRPGVVPAPRAHSVSSDSVSSDSASSAAASLDAAASDAAWWARRPWTGAVLTVAVVLTTLVVLGLPDLGLLDSARPGDAPGTAVARPPRIADQPSSPSGTRTGGRPSVPASASGTSTHAAGVDIRVRAPGARVEAGLFGPWQCNDDYVWDLGHPVLAKPCHAVAVSAGARVRMIGRMQALPGVQTDVTLNLTDADTGAVVSGPYGCGGLMFTDFAPEHSCGPFDVLLERGRRYVVVQQWRYTGRGLLPGGTARGAPFTG